MAASSALSADAAGVLGLDEVLRQVAQDDQDEWEYEYSATETEVCRDTPSALYPEVTRRFGGGG